MNVEIGAEAALFPEKEYINGIAIAALRIGLQRPARLDTLREEKQGDIAAVIHARGGSWSQIIRQQGNRGSLSIYSLLPIHCKKGLRFSRPQSGCQ